VDARGRLGRTRRDVRFLGNQVEAMTLAYPDPDFDPRAHPTRL
jgi:hypothetical protein